MRKKNPTEHPSARDLREKIEQLKDQLKWKNDHIKDLEDEVSNLKDDVRNATSNEIRQLEDEVEHLKEQAIEPQSIREVIEEMDRLERLLYNKVIAPHKLQDRLLKWMKQLEDAI